MSLELSRPVRSSWLPAPEARSLERRLAAVCDCTPISGAFEDDDLDALDAELRAGGVAILWGAPGEGPGGLGRWRERLATRGVRPAWEGLVRADGEALADMPMFVAAAPEHQQLADSLAAGPASLALDPVVADVDREVAQRQRARVAIISYEVAGPTRNGGIGTAATSLARELADAGHSVILRYTGWQPLAGAEVAQWRHSYARDGVDFDVLPEIAPGVDSVMSNHRRAFDVYRWLKTEHAAKPFDVVHFPDCQGHGYYAVMAKRLGLDFADLTFAVTLHSGTRWVTESNGVSFENCFQLADDHLERTSAELADVVISPSAYMLGWCERAGWQLPERRFVQQYVLPHNVRSLLEEQASNDGELSAALEGPGVEVARDLGVELQGGPTVPVSLTAATSSNGRGMPALSHDRREIVFFGRLEARKGLREFCDALDLLAADDQPREFEVTFLGKPAPIDGIPGDEYVARRASGWPWRCQIQAHLNHFDAAAYLRHRGRIAVIASPVDNSPHTVYESIALGIDFVAARTGGIPELIRASELEGATYEGGTAVALAGALRSALSRRRRDPVNFTVDPDANRSTIVAWHARVAAWRQQLIRTSPAREAPRQRGSQIPPLVSAVVAGDYFGQLRSSLRALRDQDIEDLEIVLSIPTDEHGPTADRNQFVADPAAPPCRLISHQREISPARARAEAALQAQGEWIWLAQPDSIAEPELLSTLIACAQSIGADFAVPAASYRSGGGWTGGLERAQRGGSWRGVAPLGGPFALLACPQSINGGVFVSRAALANIGPLDCSSIAAQQQNLVLRLLLDGRRMAVVPVPLVSVEPPVKPFWHEDVRPLISPFSERLPAEFRDLALMLGQLRIPPMPPTTAIPPDVLEHMNMLERMVESVRVSKSWRFTRPLRDARARVRPMRQLGERQT